MSGTYVDDYLTAGPPEVVAAFVNTLRKPWKSEPQLLTLDHELTFLGVTLHKQLTAICFTSSFTLMTYFKNAPHITARTRTKSFPKEVPLPPNPSIPEQEWIKRGHDQILHALCPLLLKS